MSTLTFKSSPAMGSTLLSLMNASTRMLSSHTHVFLDLLSSPRDERQVHINCHVDVAHALRLLREKISTARPRTVPMGPRAKAHQD